MDDFQPQRQWADAPPHDDPAPLRALAAAVVLQAIQDGDTAWFFGKRWRESRDFWLTAAGIDASAAQEKLAARWGLDSGRIGVAA